MKMTSNEDLSFSEELKAVHCFWIIESIVGERSNGERD